jgi:hypothetical protein
VALRLIIPVDYEIVEGRHFFLALRYGAKLFFIPRDEGDCYQPAHFRKIANEVERWGLELLPLDYHLVG